MPKTDPDPLGDGFKWRLRAELNRVQPRYSSPRYLASGRHRVSAWRFAPAGLAAGIAGMLVLTAYAATGSPNPVVWTQRIVTVIEPNASPASSPSPSQSTSHEAAPAPPTHHEDETPAAQPTEKPEPPESSEPSSSTQPSQSPEPSDGEHSGSSSGETSTQPSPSPTPGDH